MKKVALITGITGQDGSYLAELLLEKNYQVIGLGKSKTLDEIKALSPFKDALTYYSCDLRHAEQLRSILHQSKPDEVYNLASQSFPSKSWTLSLQTLEINAWAAQLLWDELRHIKPDCRIYQASSSEMYGTIQQSPQNESTPFNPVNPYAAAKLYAHQLAGIYRKGYNLFISCGILFNHESPRRGLGFVSQKIAHAAACIKLGLNSPFLNEQNEPIVKAGKVHLGNLATERDWGHAKDYVKAMWLMLQQDQADDFVIGTGQLHSVRDICEIAFSYVGLDWQAHVLVDPQFFRPIETGTAQADITKAKTLLGWQPQISFEALIAEMVDFQFKILLDKSHASVGT